MSWTDKTYNELPIMFRELVDVHTKPIHAERDQWKAKFERQAEHAKLLFEANDKYRNLLEAIRSQMCWEADRDELTMGMRDLHNSVTQMLAPDTKDEE